MDAASTIAPELRAPRERILDAARNLFYRKGIRAVSVDEIAAAANTNKMTLYRHYQSKDLLVAECLRAFAAETDLAWSAIEKSHRGNPEGQLRAWVEQIGAMVSEKGGRGCALANAAVELPESGHPARTVIEEFKLRQRERLVRLCRDAGFAGPERFADEIFLLLEGAHISVQSVGACGPGSRFAGMVYALMKGHARRK